MSVVVCAAGEGARFSLPNGHDVRCLDTAPNGAFSLLEWTAQPGLPGTAVHLHHRTDEGFYVVAGTYGFLMGDERIEASEGGYVFVPRGVVHAYRNVGSVDGIVINCPNRLYMGDGRREPIDEIRHEDDLQTVFTMND